MKQRLDILNAFGELSMRFNALRRRLKLLLKCAAIIAHTRPVNVEALPGRQDLHFSSKPWPL